MHAAAQRVIDAAEERGLRVEVREFPEGTRTAQDAAAAVGVEVGQIVKSLAFQVDGEIVLALVSGSNRLDERELALAAGAPDGQVGRANPDSVRAATGFAIGGVPPFGHAAALRTFVDSDLLEYDEVWAAAGTPRHVFAIDPNELVRASGGTVSSSLGAPDRA
ncbi:MAG TPA: YbaK/EbsC family protein [Acidimicrobiales bacterium]|jgi:prolyl-tRNA editing enzyme YbaK/EbsC (Cys-tRNA(Pro) deacylase)|nr:YbaK/EbsC family protein [Acidimicrobiales bacterium]